MRILQLESLQLLDRTANNRVKPLLLRSAPRQFLLRTSVPSIPSQLCKIPMNQQPCPPSFLPKSAKTRYWFAIRKQAAATNDQSIRQVQAFKLCCCRGKRRLPAQKRHKSRLPRLTLLVDLVPTRPASSMAKLQTRNLMHVMVVPLDFNKHFFFASGLLGFCVLTQLAANTPEVFIKADTNFAMLSPWSKQKKLSREPRCCHLSPSYHRS